MTFNNNNPAAKDLVGEFEKRIKTLEATNKALTAVSNFNMNRVADLTDQIRYWERRAKKAERGLS
jgi:lipoate synthase